MVRGPRWLHQGFRRIHDPVRRFQRPDQRVPPGHRWPQGSLQPLRNGHRPLLRQQRRRRGRQGGSGGRLLAGERLVPQGRERLAVHAAAALRLHPEHRAGRCEEAHQASFHLHHRQRPGSAGCHRTVAHHVLLPRPRWRSRPHLHDDYPWPVLGRRLQPYHRADPGAHGWCRIRNRPPADVRYLPRIQGRRLDEPPRRGPSRQEPRQDLRLRQEARGHRASRLALHVQREHGLHGDPDDPLLRHHLHRHRPGLSHQADERGHPHR